MTTSGDQILNLYKERRAARSRMINRMDEIRRAYNGDLVLPLPEMDKIERAAVANLIQQGIDQLGARVASVRPDVDCPSTYPGQPLADKRARLRRLAILGWWDHSDMEVLDGRRARHLLAYAEAPCLIRPGHSYEKAMPTWHIRDPLASYPGPRPNPDDMMPDDCIFTYDVTLGFLARRYPEAAATIEKGNNPSVDTTFTVLEYADKDEFVMLVVGRDAPSAPRGYGSTPTVAGAPHAVVNRKPNRAGICPVVIPRRTTLDIEVGKFDGMVGMHQTQAKLMALTLNAVKQNVFTKEWLVGRPGELPEVMVEADPINGRTGVVTGGVLEPQQLNPSTMPVQMMGLLDTAMRSQGGIPSEMGAESPTNVRTGKRGDAVISAAIDFPIQESQVLLARSKEHENEIAIAMSKGYYGPKTVSFYMRRMKGTPSGAVTYVPDQIFTTDVNFVDYPHAGSDANQLAVLIGQLVGLELISEESARKLHPLIDDPTHEADMVLAEAINKALLASIAQQVQAGSLAAVDVAYIETALREDRLSLSEAIIAVHNQQQQRQAQQMPPQMPGGGPPPGAMPGLAPGPGGAPGGAAVPPTVNPPTQSEQGLAQLLQTLHAPPQQTAAA
jgi:hypothetical protein